MKRQWSLMLLLVVCLYCAAPVHALTTAIGAGSSFTFTETLQPETAMVFTFHLSEKDKGNAIDAVIIDLKNGIALHQFLKANTGTYTVIADKEPRNIRVELRNTHSRFSQVDVHFNVRNTGEKNIPQALDPLETEIEKIVKLSSSMERLQFRMRTEQRDHRATVEDANERVLYWSIFQVFILIAVSGFQLWFLKRFLERKSFV